MGAHVSFGLAELLPRQICDRLAQVRIAMYGAHQRDSILAGVDTMLGASRHGHEPTRRLSDVLCLLFFILRSGTIFRIADCTFVFFRMTLCCGLLRNQNPGVDLPCNSPLLIAPWCTCEYLRGPCFTRVPRTHRPRTGVCPRDRSCFAMCVCYLTPTSGDGPRGPRRLPTVCVGDGETYTGVFDTAMSSKFALDLQALPL